MISQYLNPEVSCNKLVRLLESKGINDHNVLQAIQRVPRHAFVDEALYEKAYDDVALPIGHGQTISQPYIVALMTQLLQLTSDPNQKVLEIGTGSGYQSAVLYQFTRRVFTIERHEPLAERAKSVLKDILKYQKISFTTGDGSKGLPMFAPYDRIIVTAGAPINAVEPLLAQLNDNGILVIPTGEYASQQLEVYQRTGSTYVKHVITGVVFVPLIGQHGWKE